MLKSVKHYQLETNLSSIWKFFCVMYTLDFVIFSLQVQSKILSNLPVKLNKNIFS